MIVQFGGATPLALAGRLAAAGLRILGTSPEAIDLAEDRGRFGALLDRLGIARPDYGTGPHLDEARAGGPAASATRCWCGPPTCWAGRPWRSATTTAAWPATSNARRRSAEGRPVLIDRFLEDAVEVDVDAIADGRAAGDLRDHAAPGAGRDPLRRLHRRAARPGRCEPAQPGDDPRAHPGSWPLALEVRGLMNVQFAIFEERVYVLEVNPRASRTVPFLSKACGIPFAKLAARVMIGARLRRAGAAPRSRGRAGFAVKVPVFPFDRFPGFDPVLGPEMRSTGEAYGADDEFGLAFAKAMMAAGQPLPVHGTVFLSVNDRDKDELLPIAARPRRAGLLPARPPRGTADAAAGRGPAGRDGLQGQRGAAARRRPDPQRRDRPADQHPAGRALLLRRARAAPGGDPAPGAAALHALGGARRGRGDPAPEGECAARAAHRRRVRRPTPQGDRARRRP